MGKIAKYIFTLYISLTVLVIILSLQGRITFGHGLGDLFYMIFIVIAGLMIGLLLFKKDFEHFRVILLILALFLLVFMSLKLTVFRGPEYKWNGKILIN